MEEIKEADVKGEDKEEKIVHVKVKWSTRERLKLLGKKGDSYEDIISAFVNAELAKPPLRGEDQ